MHFVLTVYAVWTRIVGLQCDLGQLGQFLLQRVITRGQLVDHRV